MKFLTWLFSFAFLTAPLLAQNYQYQYPNDPYSSTPKPTSAKSSSSSSSYGYDKLLSYGALEVRYNYNDFKDAALDNSSGIAAHLRAQLFKPLYLDFGVNYLRGTNQASKSFDLTTLTAGVGAYIPLGSRFHLFGELGVRYDISGGLLSSLNPDSFAVYARPGLRFAVTEDFELSASALLSSTDNYNKHIVEINSYFALLSVLDLGIGVDFASDVNTYHAGIRLRW